MNEDKPQSELKTEKQNNSEFFRGVVDRIAYRDETSGFTILKAEPDAGMGDPQGNGELDCTIVGVMPSDIDDGMPIVARGVWQAHAKFGRQFRAYSVTETEPTTRGSIIRYLASSAAKGFGEVLAERVVDKFGEKTLQIIDDTPERLLEVSGIGEHKLEEIITAWKEKRNLREVFLFFQKYNLSLSLATRIYNTYGERTIETVKNNPYILSKQVYRIGFLTADRVARALGIDKLAKERLTAGIVHTMKEISDDGHCFIPKEILVEKSCKLLEVKDQSLVFEALDQALLQGDLIDENTRIYLPRLNRAERQLATSVSNRLDEHISPHPKIHDEVVESICSKPLLEAGEGDNEKVMHLSAEQKRAIKLAASSRIMVITGGPGCGKTTVVRTIASLFKKAGLTLKLTAPTGRAAQRLSEVCDMPASTIHRLLKFDPIKKSFLHDAYDQSEVDALIVDESSMIDLALAASLLQAIPDRARIVVVGDADQLPSVGPGLVLSDLLELEQMPRIKLTQLFRRAEESAITQIAHSINSAELPYIPEPDGITKSEGYFLPAETPEEAAMLIEKLVYSQLPKKFGFKHSDITVLTPMNQGKLGVIALNQKLQSRLIPRVPGMPWVKVQSNEFRLGDRVCQRVNNYNIHPSGVFNGDQGEIVGISPEDKSIVVQLWDGREVTYKKDELKQLDLAYALTIHRSQGSEVPAVILALHDTHHIMLERQLIYTGVTRAKKLLIVVGTKKALAISVKRSRSRKRNSFLKEKTIEMLSELL